MDLDDFRTVLESSGVDVWTFIDTAITVASLDDFDELKRKRDGIVERLYAASLSTRCRNCHVDRSSGGVTRPNGHMLDNSNREEKAKSHGSAKGNSPSTPQSVDRDDDDDLDPFGGLFDDEQKRILEIKGRLEDPDQSEDSLVELLQNLADMDITFQALKDSDIGRHVNQFRKHPSNDVRRLVKHLVRKWKAIVDEWVNVNQPGETASALLGADGDSPPQKIAQTSYSKVPDFGHSPNPQNGSSGSEKNYSEPEVRARTVVRKEILPQPQRLVSVSASAQNRQREQKESGFDAERLASARKRLHANYKEAENAKKQRTIQVMDIHDLPKPKNAYFGKNKAGGSQGKHW